MTRYFANNRTAHGKNTPLGSGFDTEAEAMKHGKFLADTYGGVSKVSANHMDAEVKKYSAKKGWH